MDTYMRMQVDLLGQRLVEALQKVNEVVFLAENMASDEAFYPALDHLTSLSLDARTVAKQIEKLTTLAENAEKTLKKEI